MFITGCSQSDPLPKASYRSQNAEVCSGAVVRMAVAEHSTRRIENRRAIAVSPLPPLPAAVPALATGVPPLLPADAHSRTGSRESQRRGGSAEEEQQDEDAHEPLPTALHSVCRDGLAHCAPVLAICGSQNPILLCVVACPSLPPSLMSSPSAPSSEYDCVVVGAGACGASIARDLAACGFRVLVVDKEKQVGGVWAHNHYPGLRLQGIGYAYRCMSLAPAYQKRAMQDQASKDVFYKQTREEILEYVGEMLAHANISTRLNTEYESVSDADAPVKQVKFTDGNPVSTRALIFATGYSGKHAGTPVLPFSEEEMKRAKATVMHSAQLDEATNAKLKTGGFKSIYVVGAGKAAVDLLSILSSLAPEIRDSVSWLHRGHMTFLNAAAFDADMRATAPPPVPKLAVMSMFGWMGEHQHFELFEYCWCKMGIGLTVGPQITKLAPSFRGGVFAAEVLSEVAKYKQVIIKESSMGQDGALSFVPAAESEATIRVDSADSLVLLCTGQHASDVAGKEYYSKTLLMRGGSNKGLFTYLPGSIQALTSGMFTSAMCVAYLDGDASSPYTNGSVGKMITGLSAHMSACADTSDWALSMTFLNFLLGRLPPLMFPAVLGDLSSYHKWHAEWFGKDLDVRATLKEMKGTGAAVAASASPAGPSLTGAVRGAMEQVLALSQSMPNVDPKVIEGLRGFVECMIPVFAQIMQQAAETEAAARAQ